MIKVRFLKSPTGRFALGYSAGEVGLVPASIAEAMQKEGYIELIQDEKPIYTAHAPQAKQTEKATKRKT